MGNLETERFAQLAHRLAERYGELMSLSEVAQELRLPSVHSARKARSQGRLPFVTVTVPHRRGWFAVAADVARYLADPAKRGGAP
jgi:hypothetical protein